MTQARTILVAGTASHVGKSTVAAGLCRLLADRGLDVAPFKAQNMSNNARVVPRVGGPGATQEPAADTWGEIGVSQWAQARAARTTATTDHNPVLLKPRGDGESQLVVHGRAVDHLAAGAYFDEHWQRARDAAAAAHERLAGEHDVIVAEGAGSIAEINLLDHDLANLETARLADADVLLVADVDRGGAFAALVGTLELLPDDVRERVVGAVLTKFRGDPALLQPGPAEFEARTGVPIVGVLPHDDPGLPEEDSVALPDVGESSVLGDDDGVDAEHTVTIGVPRFPRASNVTDVEPLARVPGVRVAVVPLSTSLDGEADAVVLTGTKNTVDDALAARHAGLYDALRAFDGPIVGLCGGYQLLGRRLTDVGHESAGEGPPVRAGEGLPGDAVEGAVPDALPGAGLLPVETRFGPEKTVRRVERQLRGCGPLAGADGVVSGYEIHAGETRLVGDADRPFVDDEGDRPEGAAVGDVLGTYLHGLFENRLAREAFVDRVYAVAGRLRPPSGTDDGSPYDRAADLVSAIDLESLGLESLGLARIGED